MSVSVSTIVNLVGFQLLWFACVVGAGANGLYWLAALATLTLAASVLFMPSRWRDLTIAALALCLGLVIDNFWVAIGLFEYAGFQLAPYWIGMLWFGMGLTVNHSLSWFRDRPYLGSTVVGLAAPVTYLAGERFGAVAISDMPTLLLLCPVWFLVFLLMARFAVWLEEFNNELYSGERT
jgi:hypothetical protein